MNINDCKKYEPIFNSWYVKSVLGQGSFGTVFEVQRVEFGEVYKSALKVISIPQNDDEIEQMRLDGTSEDSIKRYYDNVVKDIISELVIMSELKGNSNIVSYEDHTVIRHSDDIGYDVLIRMELLTPLIRYRSTHGMTEKDVIRLGIDICRGLELCERNNIIHRDIKPENIFVAKSGNYKLGDFGIARTIEKTNSELSRKGTYSYMAPEIYKGQTYGPSVDLYSLGIVMYSLLNGTRTPFLPPLPAEITHNDKERALMQRIAGEPIPPIRGVSPGLMDVILTACAYNKSNRYASARDMRQALERVQSQPKANPANETELVFDEDRTELSIDNGPSPGQPMHMDYIPPASGGEATEILGASPYPQDPGYDMRGEYPGTGSGGYPQYGTGGSMGYPDGSMRYPGGSMGYPGGIGSYGGGQNPPRGNRKKTTRNILIAVLCVILAGLLAVCGMLILKKHDTQESEEIAPIDANQDIHIESWDQDFSNSQEHHSEYSAWSYNIIMRVANNSDSDITGIAFYVKNHDRDTVRNENPDYEGDPFYAEGYIAAGKTGYMYANVWVSEEEFKSSKENRYGYSNQEPSSEDNDVEITDAYRYQEQEDKDGEKLDYVQATGKLEEPYTADGVKQYNVEINNEESETPVHEGSTVLAVATKLKDGMTKIIVSSANGVVGEEIDAHSSKTLPGVLKNPGLEYYTNAKGKKTDYTNEADQKLTAADFQVYVIDNEYENGDHYIDEYDEQYGDNEEE